MYVYIDIYIYISTDTYTPTIIAEDVFELFLAEKATGDGYLR